MRRQIIAGNWKMHGSRAENARWSSHRAQAAELAARSLGVPAVRVPGRSGRAIAGSAHRARAQEVCAENPEGAFTGKCPPACCATSVMRGLIVAYSDAVHCFGESDQLVARKFAALLAAA
jgi:triosephosphate isomerase